MQDMQDMMRRLNQSGKRLSKGHRKIAEYIVEHYDKAVFMTASKLGEKVGVSESTVVRFASAMGYEGYPQLQRALQELVRHWLTAVQRFEMATDINQSEVLRTVLHADMQNIRTTTEEIDADAFDQVVDKIIAARHIYVMGLRSAAPIAQFLAYYLNFIFDNVRIVSEASGDAFASTVFCSTVFPPFLPRLLCRTLGFSRRDFPPLIFYHSPLPKSRTLEKKTKSFPSACRFRQKYIFFFFPLDYCAGICYNMGDRAWQNQHAEIFF